MRELKILRSDFMISPLSFEQIKKLSSNVPIYGNLPIYMAMFDAKRELPFSIYYLLNIEHLH